MGMKAVLIAVLLMVAGGGARAAPAGDTQSAKAQYELGMKRYNVGDYREALAAFKAAYLATPDPVFLFNIGQCQRQLADYGAAARSYRAFLRESPDVAASQREQVVRLIGEMEKAESEARANQPPIGTQPPRESVEPKAPAAAAAPLVTTPPSATTTADTTAGRSKAIAGVVVAAAGLALVGGGIACGVLAKRAGDDLTALDRAGGQFDRAKEQSGELNQTLSGVLLGVGAAAVVTGVIVGALGLRERSARRHASIAPLAAPTAGGALVTVSY